MKWFPTMGVVLALASAAAGDDVLDKRISLNLKQAAASELYPLFAQLLGAGASVETEADPRVDLVFNHITARTALNAFCESAGCSWELMAGAPPTLRFYSRSLAEEKRITVDLAEASLPDVVKLAGQILETEVWIDPALQDKTISIERKEQTVAAILDAVCAEIGCEWTIEPGELPTLRLRPAPRRSSAQ